MASFDDQAPVGADSTNPTGILFNKPDLRALQRYRMTAAALPDDESGVSDYLGILPQWPDCLQSQKEALSAGAFLSCFKAITEHAEQWASLESRLRLTSQKLVLFADQLNAALLLVKHSWDQSALARLAQDPAPAQALSEEGQRLKMQCAAVLAQISEHAERLHGHATGLLSDLTAFRRRLEETIMAELSLKMTLVHKVQAQLAGSTVTTRLSELKETYNQLFKTYEASVSTASTWDVSLAKTLVGLFVVLPEEETRRQLDALSQEYLDALRQMVHERQAALAFSHLMRELPQVNLISVCAKVSVGRVVDLWSGLQVYADQQALHLGKLNEPRSLSAFYREFSLMVAPWQDIASTSQHLKGVWRD